MLTSIERASRGARLKLGRFLFDPATGELEKDGSVIRLQPQPARILTLLASRPGDILTRDELCRSVWGDDTFVDFEQGLNFCIRRIRAALGDDARRPRHLETLPRRGYRLVAPVEPMRDDTGVRPSRVMLAVLPLRNLSGEPEREYISDGLTDELMTQLSRLSPERLGIIARTSAWAYKGRDKSLDEIGRELRVQYVLEGSVRSAGSRMRVSVRLALVRDQTQVWAETHERALTDVLSLQDELAGALTRDIGARLAPEAEPPRARRPLNTEAYHAYIRGRYCWNKRTVDGLRQGVAYFEAAIRADPGYASAHAGLADCYAFLNHAGSATSPSSSMFDAAEAEARKAIALDDSLAEAHASLAHLRMHAFDWPTAERELLRALELDPNYATARQWYAFYLALHGRHDEALTAILHAQELDPVSLVIAADVGQILCYAGRLSEAIEQYLRVLEMDPGFVRASMALGSTLALAGRHDEAIASVRRAQQMDAHPTKTCALARVCAAAGKRDEAAAVLSDLKAQPGILPSYPVALVYAALRDFDSAFEWLARAVQEKAPDLVFLGVDPWLYGLRSDPRFDELLHVVGLARGPLPGPGRFGATALQSSAEGSRTSAPARGQQGGARHVSNGRGSGRRPTPRRAS